MNRGRGGQAQPIDRLLTERRVRLPNLALKQFGERAADRVIIEVRRLALRAKKDCTI